MVQIIPTILVKDKSEFEEKLARISGLVERVQVDVIDGVFADNKTLDFSEVSRANFSGKIDIHLMVNEPIEWIGKAVRFGADRLIGHIERMNSQGEFINQTKTAGMSAGLALDSGTKIEGVDSSLWGQINTLLVMAVKAGFSGQIFREQSLSVIKAIKAIKDSLSLDLDIMVDGGVNLKNIKACVEKGATSLAIDSALWRESDIREKLTLLKRETKKAIIM